MEIELATRPRSGRCENLGSGWRPSGNVNFASRRDYKLDCDDSSIAVELARAFVHRGVKGHCLRTVVAMVYGVKFTDAWFRPLPTLPVTPPRYARTLVYGRRPV